MKDNLLLVIVFSSFMFCLGCASDTSEGADTPTTSEVNEAEEMKKKAEEEAREAERLAEEARLLEEERLLAEKDSLEQAQKKLAELRKKKKEEERRKKREEERRKKAEAEKKSTSTTTNTTPKPTPKTGAKIKFNEKIHNFGTITEGEVVKYEFFYTNEGTEPLVIKDASATCGCTAPGFSFFPLDPGLSSAISVSFNSKGKVGPQRPEVTIITNGYPSKHVLTMEGVVVK